jgi:hypothetical protein
MGQGGAGALAAWAKQLGRSVRGGWVNECIMFQPTHLVGSAVTHLRVCGAAATPISQGRHGPGGGPQCPSLRCGAGCGRCATGRPSGTPRRRAGNLQTGFQAVQLRSDDCDPPRPQLTASRSTRPADGNSFGSASRGPASPAEDAGPHRNPHVAGRSAAPLLPLGIRRCPVQGVISTWRPGARPRARGTATRLP